MGGVADEQPGTHAVSTFEFAGYPEKRQLRAAGLELPEHAYHQHVSAPF